MKINKYWLLSGMGTFMMLSGYIIRSYGSFHGHRGWFLTGGLSFSLGAILFAAMIFYLIKK
jgi:uncharacterized membrane protein